MEIQDHTTIKEHIPKEERTTLFCLSEIISDKMVSSGYIKDRTFYTFRNDKSQTIKKFYAIGISYQLLKEGKDNDIFDFIAVMDEGNILQTSIDYFLHKGEYMVFNENKQDEYIFLKFSDFGMDAANKYEDCLLEKLNIQLKNLGENLKSRSLEIQAEVFNRKNNE